MSNQKEPSQVRKLEEVHAVKAYSWKEGEGKHLREGIKPSAPANLALPKPVAIPAPQAASNNGKTSGK